MKRAKRYDNTSVVNDYFTEIKVESLELSAELKRRQDFLKEIRKDLEDFQFAWAKDLSGGDCENIVATETARRLAFRDLLRMYRQVFSCYGRPY